MKKGILVGIIVLLLIVVAASSLYTVEENQYACIFRFSEIVQMEDHPVLPLSSHQITILHLLFPY